jgi:hypothetical protein
MAERAGKLLDEMVPSRSARPPTWCRRSPPPARSRAGVGQINGAMGQLNQATQQNASASEELAATAEEWAARPRSCSEVLDAAVDRIEAVPTLGVDLPGAFLLGMLRLDSGYAAWLSLEQLLAPAQLSELIGSTA